MGPVDRSASGPLADRKARTPPRLDRHPTVRDPDLHGRLEHDRPEGQSLGGRCDRSGHRHCFGDPGHHHRCAENRADRRERGKCHGRRRGDRRRRVVDRLQARGRRRAGYGGIAAAGRSSGLLAGHVPGSGIDCDHLQHRLDVRPRTAARRPRGRSGRGRPLDRRPAGTARPGTARPGDPNDCPGSPGPSSGR